MDGQAETETRGALTTIEVYAARLIAPLVVAALIAVVSILWNFNGRLATIEANEKSSLVQWDRIEKRLERIEEKLDRRMP